MKRNKEIKGTATFFGKKSLSPLFQRNGFLSLEYALLIAILVAALIGTAFYFQRSLSGKWREAGDNFGFGRQYNK